MSLYRNVNVGLGTGSITAIIAVLVSLPLESPDDIVFNAASVGFTAIGFGGLTGLAWHWSQTKPVFKRQYCASSIGLLIAAFVVAGAAQTQFDDAIVFTVPLTFISTVIPIVATPSAAKSSMFENWHYLIVVVIAVVLSVTLAGQGDQQSGVLSLSPAP